MIAETITTSILASCLYDMLKHSVEVTAGNLKLQLQRWAVDDATSNALERQISDLPLNDEMSERAIERELVRSRGIMEIINNYRPRGAVTVYQTHSGHGDNVAGDKIIK